MSYRQEYGKTYVTNDVLSHIFIPAEGTCSWRPSIGVLDLQSRSKARRLSRTLTAYWVYSWSSRELNPRHERLIQNTGLPPAGWDSLLPFFWNWLKNALRGDDNFINIFSIISLFIIQLSQFSCIGFKEVHSSSFQEPVYLFFYSAYQGRRKEAELRYHYWHFIRRIFHRGSYYHSTGTPLSEKEVARKTASFECNAVWPSISRPSKVWGAKRQVGGKHPLPWSDGTLGKTHWRKRKWSLW